MATQYATVADLANVLGPAVLNTVSTAQQNAALMRASELFDSKARQHFDMPIISVGQDVVDAVTAVAAYRLLLLRGTTGAGGDEALKEQYDAAIKFLDEVGKGLAIPDVVDSSTAGTFGGPVIMCSAQRGFTDSSDTLADGGDNYTYFWHGDN